jgi:hypothetical protein
MAASKTLPLVFRSVRVGFSQSPRATYMMATRVKTSIGRGNHLSVRQSQDLPFAALLRGGQQSRVILEDPAATGGSD